MMATLRDLSILWSLFHILVLFMLLYRSRFTRRTTVIATVLCMGPLIAFNLWGIAQLGLLAMAQSFLVTCTLPSLVFYFIMSKDRGGRFFFTFCLADTFAYWIIILTNLADFYLHGNGVIMFVTRLLAFPAAELLVWRFLRPPYLEVQRTVPKGWGLFAAMAALYYVLLAVMANWPAIVTQRPENMPAMLLVLLLMPMTYMTIFSALYRQLLLFRTKESDQALAADKERLEAQLENQQAIRRLHHDMKAFHTTLSGLLADGQLEEARSFLAEAAVFEGKAGSELCTDPYLNSVLNHFAGKLEAAGSKLDSNVQLGTEPLPHTELCLILSNALENATEAVHSLPEKDCAVSVQMYPRGAYLLLRVKNRCTPGLTVKRGNLPPTTKNGPGHGYGIETICRTAEKLGGNAVCYTEDGYFLLDVMVRRQPSTSETKCDSN